MPYTVKAGDNFWDLAPRLGMTAEQFMSLNPHLDRRAPGAAPGTGFGLLQVGDQVNTLTDTPVQPGLTHEQFLLQLALGEKGLTQQKEIEETRQADLRRLQEAQLGANPADFVAYELYKRSLVEQGFQPEGAVRSDVDIQNLFSTALDLNEGTSAGVGQFGVDIPTTQSISRSELQGLSKTAIDTLSSFLRGGVDTGEGQFQGINPADYFTELEEGLVPVLPGQRTQFVF